MIGRAFVEDALTRAVLEQICAECNKNYSIVVKNGSGNLRNNIDAYNRTARSIPIIVLRDLDNIVCPSVAVHDWLPKEKQNPHLIFHVIEHEIEAWVMADRDKFAQWLNCRRSDIPVDLDSVVDPKVLLFQLVQKSKCRRIQKAILPHGSAACGPEYNSTLSAFVHNHWRMKMAAQNSRNLSRFREKLAYLNSVCPINP